MVSLSSSERWIATETQTGTYLVLEKLLEHSDPILGQIILELDRDRKWRGQVSSATSESRGGAEAWAKNERWGGRGLHTHTHTTHSQTQSAKSKTVTENKAVELTCHARSGSWVGWLGGCGWVEATLNIRPVAFNASDSSSTPANYSSTSPDHHHSKLARSYLAQPLTSDDEPCNQQLRHLANRVATRSLGPAGPPALI